MKKTLIFDLDGTLVDTTEAGFKKVNGALTSISMPTIPIPKLKEQWGLPWYKLCDWICEYSNLDDEQVKMFKYYEKAFHEYSLDSRIMPVLSKLSQRNNLIALVTSRSMSSLEHISGIVKLDLNVFQFIQTAEVGEFHKPDPRVFDSVIDWSTKNGQAKLGDMVYFGDTVTHDYGAVLNRPPMDFVGVISGVNTEDEFCEAGLHKSKIVDFHKLPDYLRQYEN